MSEQKKLLKKAVMAGVGASASVDRIKTALNDVMQDLVKVGQELFDELETKGKDKTDSFSKELKKIQEEAARRTSEAEKKVSTKFQGGTKKVAKDAGLATREDLEEVLERLSALEEAIHGSADSNGGDEEAHETSKKRSRKSTKE